MIDYEQMRKEIAREMKQALVDAVDRDLTEWAQKEFRPLINELHQIAEKHKRRKGYRDDFLDRR